MDEGHRHEWVDAAWAAASVLFLVSAGYGVVTNLDKIAIGTLVSASAVALYFGIKEDTEDTHK